MGFHFDGATTPWKSQTETWVSEFPTAPGEKAADDESVAIGDKIRELRTEANLLAQQALTYINECASYSASAVNVVYTPPAYIAGSYNRANVGTAPVVTGALKPGSNPPVTIKTISVIDPLVDGGAASATLPTASTAPKDSGLGTMPSSPQDPVINDITLTTPPTLTIDTSPTPLPAPPTIQAIAPTVGTPLTPTTLNVSIDGEGDIAAAIAALTSIVSATYPPPANPNIFPELLTAVGMMIAGNSPLHKAIIDAAITRAEEFDNKYNDDVNSIWSKRGASAYSDTYIAEFVTRETLRMTTQRNIYKRMITELWKDDQFVAGLKLGAFAHNMQMDMKIAEFDMQFNALLGTAEAQLELIKSAEYAYKGAIATLEADAANLTAEYASASSDADVFNTMAGVQASKADVNRAIASVFEAQESAKSVEIDLAEVGKYGDVALLKAYEANMKLLSAQAELATLDLEKYKGDVAKWGADIIDHKVELEQYKARASRVKAANTAKISALTSQEADHSVSVADTTIDAAKASIKAGKEVFDATLRAGQIADTEYKNMLAAATDKEAMAIYMLDTGKEAARIMSLRAELAGITEENQSASSFFTAAAEAAGRAADLTQASNTQLSEAYATAQEAAGRAAAAVETGRLSGWNASATISASGTLDASWSSSSTSNTSFNTSVTQAQNAVTETGYQ
jgi:hypothetical protein